MLAINEVAKSIAYPPDHLGNLDSSTRINNDSDEASEKLRGVLYPDLGKSLRKKIFSKEYLRKEKRGAPFPRLRHLSNGQKTVKKYTVCKNLYVLLIYAFIHLWNRTQFLFLKLATLF